MHQFFSASIDLASAEVKGVCGWACVREREWEAGQGIIWVRAWANIAMTTPEGILCQKLESSAQGILKSCKFYLQNKPRHSGCKFYLLINKCTSPWLHKGGRSRCSLPTPRTWTQQRGYTLHPSLTRGLCLPQEHPRIGPCPSGRCTGWGRQAQPGKIQV